MKAITLLKSNITAKARAEEFSTSIKRNIQKKILDKLAEEIERIDDKLFENKDFTLETNLNSGKSAITREECEKRFTDIIELEFEREMLARELEIKQTSFNTYFKETQEEV